MWHEQPGEGAKEKKCSFRSAGTADSIHGGAGEGIGAASVKALRPLRATRRAGLDPGLAATLSAESRQAARAPQPQRKLSSP
jgi:hypothetical protein